MIGKTNASGGGGGSTTNYMKAYLDNIGTGYLFYNDTTDEYLDNLIGYEDTSDVTSFQYMFYECSSLIRAPDFDTSNGYTFYGMFLGCINLKIVPAYNVGKARTGTISKNRFNFMFEGCESLEEIHMYGMKYSFDISASTQFTESALVEILNNLGTVTTTQTLTMGADNLAKLTEEEKAIATNKGWTLA